MKFILLEVEVYIGNGPNKNMSRHCYGHSKLHSFGDALSVLHVCTIVSYCAQSAGYIW